jgi:hypothetical protein
VVRKWSFVAFVALCLVVAAAVAWWPRDDVVVRVESADSHGICFRNVRTGERECLAYTPEFPSEARYRAGECLRLTYVYRSDPPPHAERVTCPAA